MDLIDLAARRQIHVGPDPRYPWRQAPVAPADEDGSTAAAPLSGCSEANGDELERWIAVFDKAVYDFARKLFVAKGTCIL